MHTEQDITEAIEHAKLNRSENEKIKGQLIDDIISGVKHAEGDLFFKLCFCSIETLTKIKKEAGIN